MNWRHVYGPVPSRRLGRSLGVNPIPSKTCDFSCAYCQLGRTTARVVRRRRFFPPEEILDELAQAARIHGAEADFVTFVGEGEPTLSRDLGLLLTETRKLTATPIAVITNGSLLHRSDVRRELGACDVVMPSLDAPDEDTFRRLNRPPPQVRLATLVDGLVRFREEFAGSLRVEVMLVKGCNDSEAKLVGLRRLLDRIRPDLVYLNLPIRPPAEPWVEPPDAEGLERAQTLLAPAVLTWTTEEGEFSTVGFDDPVEAVLMIARRHPMRSEQIAETLGRRGRRAPGPVLQALVASGHLRALEYRGDTFYVSGAAPWRGDR
ncbi:MAG: radical SAM protein [Gemmatimonadota bacterium]